MSERLILAALPARLFFIASALLIFSAFAQAEPQYSASVHKNAQGHAMATLTAFDDVESCRETAKERAQAMGADWQPVSSDCRALAQMSGEELKMFARQEASRPYLYFTDPNGFKTVVYFTEVPPVMLDAMLWKWRSELEKQGMKDLELVMDPKRRKLLELVGKAREKLPEDAPKTQVAAAVMNSAEIQEPPPRPAMAKNDSLLLSNGQTVTGQILERRPDGVWFRLDEGTDMLFSNAEVREVLPGSSAE